MSERARLALLLLAAVLAGAHPASAANRPDSYAEFDTSIPESDGRVLKAAIERGTPYIFVRRGRYVLDNPVVIDRSGSLFLHGADRMQTVLIARNPEQPLFIVKRAELVNFAGLLFSPTRDFSHALNAQAIATRNTVPLRFEMLDCAVGNAMLAFEGPGTYQIQTPMLGPGGRARAAIWVDHPEADVLVFAGDGSNADDPLHTDDFAFVWQKRGRVRIHSTTFEGTLGPGDVRIESASKLGPHVIANVRSEGVSGALAGTGASSRFLHVPPTAEKVDVVLKANGGSWDTGPRKGSLAQRMNCSMISYHGAGTVWLLGNRAEAWCGRRIAEGHAPEATIVSVGNLISSPEPFALRAKRIITADDLFDFAYWTGNPSAAYPTVRWIPNGVPGPRLSSYPDVPRVPEDLLPPPLLRPRVTAALPDMIDVKRDYGAKGDGTTDDTRAIQKALDAKCDGETPKSIFFPEGTYRITDTLYLNHHRGGRCRKFPYGGWIAGPGSRSTTIRMDPATKKGVFATDGLAAATIQGLTFKTWSYRPGDPEQVNFDIEFHPGHLASQLDTLFDVVLDGGFAGFATGVKHPTAAQCSSMVMFGGEIRNTHIGFISGHYNALANGVVRTRFVDNDYAMGSWTDLSNQGAPPHPMPPGGTFFAYDSESRGTRVQDFLFAGSANGSVWYFYDYDSDAPRFFASTSTSAPWPIMFDRARLAPRPGAQYLFDVGSSQGPFFLHSTATRSAIRVGQTSMGQSYAIKLHSKIADWSDTIAPAPNGQIDSLD